MAYHRDFNEPVGEEWEELWHLVDDSGENDKYVLHLVAPGGEFELRFPPINIKDQLQLVMREAARSMSMILKQDSSRIFRSRDAVKRLKAVMRRGRLLPIICACRRYYRENPQGGRFPGVFGWDADAWGCSFQGTGDSPAISWYPIYNPPHPTPPPPPADTSDSSGSDDDDDPGPSGAHQRGEDVDDDSSSLGGQTSSKKRKSDTSYEDESSPTKRRRL